MAKGTAAKETTEETPPKVTVSLEELYAAFSEDERAELLSVTGQDGMSTGEKTPTLKINYCDLADKNGKTIKKGNWVMFQDTSESTSEVVTINSDGEEETEEQVIVEDIGIDLGKAPKITVFLAGFKYNYYPKDKDKKKFCSSQLVFDQFNETAVGSRLGFECRKKGACPLRAETCDPKDKCGCQWVVFCEVTLPESGEKVKAVLYLKGKSYFPFGDYLKEAGTTPLFFAPTKLTTSMERNEAVTYWIVKPVLLKDQLYPALEVKEYFNVAAATKAAAEAQKAKYALEQKKKNTTPIANKSEGSGAKQISHAVADDDVTDIEF